jgi:hypothetical protein
MTLLRGLPTYTLPRHGARPRVSRASRSALPRRRRPRISASGLALRLAGGFRVPVRSRVPESLPLGWHCDVVQISARSSQNLCLWAGIAMFQPRRPRISASGLALRTRYPRFTWCPRISASGLALRCRAAPSPRISASGLALLLRPGISASGLALRLAGGFRVPVRSRVPESLPLGWHCDVVQISARSSQNLCLWAGIAMFQPRRPRISASGLALRTRYPRFTWCPRISASGLALRCRAAPSPRISASGLALLLRPGISASGLALRLAGGFRVPVRSRVPESLPLGWHCDVVQISARSSQNLCLWAGIAMFQPRRPRISASGLALRCGTDLRVEDPETEVVPESLPLGWHCYSLAFRVVHVVSQNLCLWAGIAMTRSTFHVIMLGYPTPRERL